MRGVWLSDGVESENIWVIVPSGFLDVPQSGRRGPELREELRVTTTTCLSSAMEARSAGTAFSIRGMGVSLSLYLDHGLATQSAGVVGVLSRGGRLGVENCREPARESAPSSMCVAACDSGGVGSDTIV